MCFNSHKRKASTENPISAKQRSKKAAKKPQVTEEDRDEGKAPETPSSTKKQPQPKPKKKTAPTNTQPNPSSGSDNEDKGEGTSKEA